MRQSVFVLSWTAGVMVAGVLPSAGSAQDRDLPLGFAGKAHFVVAAERMTGLSSWTGKANTTGTFVGGDGSLATLGATLEGSGRRLAFLGAGGPLDETAVAVQPRLGGDYFVYDRFSVGGALAYVSESGRAQSVKTATANNASATVSDSGDLDERSLLVVSARVGHATRLGDAVTLWLRGGITYSSVSERTQPKTLILTSSGATQTAVSGTSELSVTGTQLAVDALVVVPISGHGAFTVGVVAEIPIGGRVESKTVTADSPPSVVTQSGSSSMATLGLTGGLLVWF